MNESKIKIVYVRVCARKKSKSQGERVSEGEFKSGKWEQE